MENLILLFGRSLGILCKISEGANTVSPAKNCTYEINGIYNDFQTKSSDEKDIKREIKNLKFFNFIITMCKSYLPLNF